LLKFGKHFIWIKNRFELNLKLASHQ